jgi:hypothetical protein
MPAPFHPPNVFIYRPGTSGEDRWSAGIPVYTVWAQLMTDLTATAGQKKIIFDDSDNGGSPCVVPSGSWDMTDVTWERAGFGVVPAGAGRVTVQLNNGANVTNLFRINGLYLKFPTTLGTPALRYTANGGIFFDDCFVANDAGASTPGIRLSGGINVTIFGQRTTFGGNSEWWILLDGADTVNFDLSNRCQVRDDSIRGLTGTVGSIRLDSSSSFNTSQPGFNDPLPAFTLESEAALVSVDPGSFSYYTADQLQDFAAEADALAGASASNVVYVSQQGNDSNSGDRPSLAKRNISSAITAASALTPGSSNPVVIEILDAGVYTSGAFTLPDYVSLHGPSATIQTTSGTIQLGEASKFQAYRVQGNHSAVLLRTPFSTTMGWVEVDQIENTGSGGGLATLATTMSCVRVGSITTGIASPLGGGGPVAGTIDFVDYGGSSSAVNIGGGTADLRIGRIEATSGGTGIGVGNTGSARIQVNRINATDAYDTNVAGTLHLVANEILGTPQGSGNLTRKARVSMCPSRGTTATPAMRQANPSRLSLRPSPQRATWCRTCPTASLSR